LISQSFTCVFIMASASALTVSAVQHHTFWELSMEEAEFRPRSCSDFAVTYMYSDSYANASCDTCKDTGSDSEAETISPKFCWSSESEDEWGSEDDASSVGMPESVCNVGVSAPTSSQTPPGSWQHSAVQQSPMPAWNFAAQQTEQWRFACALNARKMAMGNQISDLANAAMQAVTRAEKAEKRALRTRAFKAAAKSG
jgi:hypothetical protein